MEVPLADIEIPEAENKNLNRAVAVVVVVFGTVMAITSVKDDNIVQAMQLTKTEVVDTWAEYQANRLKRHISESALVQNQALRAVATPAMTTVMEGYEAKLKESIDRYEAKSNELFKKAKELEKKVEVLSFRDDQFDISEALLSMSLAIIGVSALIESWALFSFGVLAGGTGVAFSLAGFAGWNIYSGWLAKLLT